MGEFITKLVPADVAKHPLRERVRYFNDDVIFTHRNMDLAREELRRACREEAAERISLLVGPTGCGKTTVAASVYKGLWTDAAPALVSDLVTIPAVMFEPEPPERGDFDWASFYEDLLELLLEPTIGSTLPETVRVAGNRKLITLAPEEYVRRPSVRQLRRRVRKALLARNTRHLFIDEAVDLVTAGSSGYGRPRTADPSLRHANVLKSMVNRLPTRILLIGSYEAFSLAHSSSQLARRTAPPIHIPRYVETPEDIAEFIKIFQTMVRHLPIPRPLDLSPYELHFFKESFGIVGLLKKLLTRLLQLISHKSNTFHASMIEKCCFLPRDKDAYQAEIARGDHLFGLVRDQTERAHESDSPEDARKLKSKNGKRPGKGNWRAGGVGDPST